MRIVAIGGGGVGAGETLSIDREIIGQTGKDNPRALFVPTASDDNEEYASAFRGTYEAEGCSVEVLRLLSTDNAETAKQKLDASDLVYVGGGNTKAMIALWKETGFDKLLCDFVASDRPVGGLSAGALCWFRIANSDWPQFEGIPGVNTAPLDCLGLVDLALCPHTRDEGFRLAEFAAMMHDVQGVGIGIDDCCAIQIIDDEYRIIASQQNSFAHRLYKKDGEIWHELLEPHVEYKALDQLKDTGTTIGKLVPKSE
jgi:dipeptidase E